MVRVARESSAFLGLGFYDKAAGNRQQAAEKTWIGGCKRGFCAARKVGDFGFGDIGLEMGIEG